MATQNPIHRKGENKACAYVWTKSAGQQTSQTAIISAHGDSAWITGTFPKGNYKLTYFCPHGYNLVDVGLSKFVVEGSIRREVQEVQSYPTIGQDYNLMKYQNRHNKNNESYEVVKNVVDSGTMDVISIKNQRDMYIFGKAFGDQSGMKLSELITLLLESGYNYENFLCAFCRGGDINSFFSGSKKFEPAKQMVSEGIVFTERK